MEKELTVAGLSKLFPIVESCIAEGSDVVLTVTGNSMRPYLRHLRDQVVLTACNPAKLRTGDLPLYRRADGRYVLHRVVGHRADGYVMCGDAQTDREYGVSSDCILAKAKGFYRRGRYVSCTAGGYRLYVQLWMWLRPCRPLLLRCGAALKRAGRRIGGFGGKRA